MAYGCIFNGCIFKEPDGKVILAAYKKESLVADLVVAELLGMR